MDKLFLPKLVLVVIVIVTVILLSLFLAYGTGSADPVSVFFKKIYPAFFVGNTMVSIYDHNQHQAIAFGLDPNIGFAAARNQLIAQLKAQALAKNLGVFPADVQQSQEKVFLTKHKQEELKDIRWDFDRLVVLSSAIKAQLAVKYYSDRNSNKADDILRRIKNGTDFESIAKAESDDKITGQFGGDMGFFERGDILPELENKIISAPQGQVFDQIVVSRLGHHIIYPVETAEVDGVTKWHAKHILIEGSGFVEWLASQTANVRVWQIIR